MRSIRLSPAAQKDLDGIWDYTCDTWSIGQAETYIRMLERAIREVANGERRGRPMDDVRAGYLRLSAGSHRVCYRLHPDTLDVIRILHARMDIPTRLGETP